MSDEEQSVGGAPLAAPPTNRMVVAVLALGGFFVALYLFAHNLGLGGPIVCGVCKKRFVLG